jgi:hypothetical protein
MNKIDKLIEEIAYRYHSENPEAKIITDKIIKGYGWYYDKVGELFKIWNKQIKDILSYLVKIHIT